MAAPDLSIDDAFSPPGEPWLRVSPRLATARRFVLLVWVVVLLVGLGVLAALVPDARTVAGVLAVVVVVGALWAWVYIGRRVRSFGYAQRSDDLLVTSGILLRRMVIVPYGRMQLVDITAGPVDRWFGVATLQLHTAAASTEATIPGLPPGVAADLRDRLAALGEQRSAGL